MGSSVFQSPMNQNRLGEVDEIMSENNFEQEESPPEQFDFSQVIPFSSSLFRDVSII
jgi:alpha-tubulin suppressor-like RCC1 family protein